ncbi:MAG: RnfH family protein [Pseudomonadales bacterium]|nr:RnfH family protein [Pseudomonadales bacterium]
MSEIPETDETLSVEVAYALPNQQVLIPLKVAQGTTAFDAIQLSKIQKQFPDIDPETAKVGIFGKALTGKESAKTYVVQEGDRVEIYRPLIADPKAARRKRAEKAKEN